MNWIAAWIALAAAHYSLHRWLVMRDIAPALTSVLGFPVDALIPRIPISLDGRSPYPTLSACASLFWTGLVIFIIRVA